MSTPAKKTIRDVAILAVSGLVYYLFCSLTGTGFKCFFKAITGYPCPSCGISHMFINLFHLNFREAFADNQFLFITWPLVAAEIIYIIYRLESKKDLPRTNVILIGVYAGLLGIFGTLRIIFISQGINL